MAAGGLDPYDDGDIKYHNVNIYLQLTAAELAMLNHMAERGKITRSRVVTLIMRDVIADEMAEQGGALPQKQRVSKCA